MTFKQFFPSPPLQHIVEYYFHHTESFNTNSFSNLYSTPVLECLAFSFTTGTSSKMQYGDKMFDLNGQAHLFGQPIHPCSLMGKYTDYIVVKFKPLGVWHLTGISMHHIANEIIAAEDIFGNSLHTLYEQMQETESVKQRIEGVENFLLNHCKKWSKAKSHPAVVQALRSLGEHKGNITVKAMQEKTCTTRKTLERAFVNQLGLHPKLYSRIVRYNYAKTLIERTSSIDWQKIIHQYGYYDQSHFINEFKAFSGKTPQEYYQNRISMSGDLSILLSPGNSLNT